MPHIVTKLCRDCKTTTCVSVCPVDCFYVPKEPSEELPDQLYISPNECIDCFACIPECPWEAIFEERDLPKLFNAEIELNKQCDTQRDKFETAPETEAEIPTDDEIKANKLKWDFKDE